MQLMLHMLVLWLSQAIFWCRPGSSMSGKSHSFFPSGVVSLQRHINMSTQHASHDFLWTCHLCANKEVVPGHDCSLEHGWPSKGAALSPSNGPFSLAYSFLPNCCLCLLTKSFLFPCVCSDPLMRLGLFFSGDVKCLFPAHPGLLLIRENAV